jgi:hypothetical protein
MSSLLISFLRDVFQDYKKYMISHAREVSFLHRFQKEEFLHWPVSLQLISFKSDSTVPGIPVSECPPLVRFLRMSALLLPPCMVVW